MQKSNSTTTPKTIKKNRNPVILFVPNIIDYGRIVTAICSFFYMRTNPSVAMALYAVSVLLDTVDGECARRLKQCSVYGSVLDMVIDRCSTMSLQMVLCAFYPEWSPFFQVLSALDISSHWAHMYYSLISKKQSHKIINKNDFRLLQFYYRCRLFMTILIITNEGFFLSLYGYHFYGDVLYQLKLFPNLRLSVFALMSVFFAPFAFLKQFINVQQIIAAMSHIAELDWMSMKQNK